MDNEIILNVYFCGTGGSIKSETTFIGTFYKYCNANVLLKYDNKIETNKNKSYKISFNGCGYEYNFRGSIFGHGLNKQCDQLISVISELIKLKHKIICNCLGLSRGAIALLILSKKIQNLEYDNISMNLILFDPVPGNFITTK